MVERKTLSGRIAYIAIIIILILLALSCILPLIYTLAVSLSSKTAVAAGKVTLWPVDFTLFSYKEIMKDSRFFYSFWTSIKRVALGTAISLITVVMAAYPLSRPDGSFRGKKAVTWVLVICMMFNGGLVPWYLTVKGLGLIDSIWALVLGGGLPIFHIILVLNFFRAIPMSLEEAAVVDGAGPWRILFQIIVPLSLPVMATVALFTLVYHWNEFFNGLVLTTQPQNYPLQTYIQQLVVVMDTSAMTVDQYERMDRLSNQTLNAAKIFISMVPVLLIYPLLQKYFISGILIGSVKE